MKIQWYICVKLPTFGTPNPSNSGQKAEFVNINFLIKTSVRFSKWKKKEIEKKWKDKKIKNLRVYKCINCVNIFE